MRFCEIYNRISVPGREEGCPVDLYNCGSYALDVREWFAPYIDGNEEEDFEDEPDYYLYTDYERDDRVKDMLDEGYGAEDILPVAIEWDWKFILAACPWLEEIQLSEAKDDDRVIAYRLSIDDEIGWSNEEVVEDMDFHFRVRINGVWYEKCGGSKIFTLGKMTQEEFEEPWENDEVNSPVYTGPIRYARFKR